MAYSPTPISGLPSPYETAGGLVYFPRMVAKIRLHQAGKLTPSHVTMLGAAHGYDGRCCRFLGVTYEALKEQALSGEASVEELLEWCFANGRRPNEEEIEVWNDFLMKRGRRDSGRAALVRRLTEANLPLDGEIQTIFDYIDYDEGRPLRKHDDVG